MPWAVILNFLSGILRFMHTGIYDCKYIELSFDIEEKKNVKTLFMHICI